MTLPIDIEGHRLILHVSGAALLEREKVLLIADVHLGKVTHFRRHGIALPPHSAAGNFRQLSVVADFFHAETICFLGDLFHSRQNREWELFAEWVRSRSEKLILVSGNHDIISPKAYEALGVQVVDELIAENLLLIHEPEIREGFFTVCGHVHPGIRLHGHGRQSLKLPCFFTSEQQLILPAFGEFTGRHVITLQENDRVYAITGDEVIRVS